MTTEEKLERALSALREIEQMRSRDLMFSDMREVARLALAEIEGEGEAQGSPFPKPKMVEIGEMEGEQA